MNIEKTEIDKAIIIAIDHAYKGAIEATDEAKESIMRAINRNKLCAGLVEKAKQMKPQNLAGFLSEIMSGQEIKRFLSIHYTSTRCKRGVLADRRQLELNLPGFSRWSEVEEAGDVIDVEVEVEKIKPTVINTFSVFYGRFNKAIDSRPVEQMTEHEREQTKDVLRPIVESITSYFDAL